VPSPCPRLGYPNNGQRWSVVQGRLERRGDDVVAPPCNRVLDYTTSEILCQQRMRNGQKTSRHRRRPAALGSAWGRGGTETRPYEFVVQRPGVGDLRPPRSGEGHRECAAGRRRLGTDGLQPPRLCAGRAYPPEQVESRRHRWMPPSGPWRHLPHMEYSPCELGTG